MFSSLECSSRRSQRKNDLERGQVISKQQNTGLDEMVQRYSQRYLLSKKDFIKSCRNIFYKTVVSILTIQYFWPVIMYHFHSGYSNAPRHKHALGPTNAPGTNKYTHAPRYTHTYPVNPGTNMHPHNESGLAIPHLANPFTCPEIPLLIYPLL